MQKVLKAGSQKKFELYAVENFGTVERGEKSFDLQRFDSEQSVQDINKKKAYTYQPQPKPIKAVIDDVKRDEEVVTTRVFGSYDDDDHQRDAKHISPFSMENFDTDFASKPQHPEESTRPPEDAQIHESESQAVKESDTNHVEFEGNVHAEEDIEKLLEAETEIALLKEQIATVTAEKQTLVLEKEQLIADKDAEIQQIKTAAIEEGKKIGFDEGYKKASDEFAEKEMKQYEAEKADYISVVEKNFEYVNEEINKIKEILDYVDKEMPEIIMGYVKELIGAERKLNNNFVVNVVSSALEKLRDLQNIVFTVNPDDAAIITEKYPQYGVSLDPAMPKGNVKIKTKVGEIDLSVDSWIKELELKINEQFKTSTDS